MNLLGKLLNSVFGMGFAEPAMVGLKPTLAAPKEPSLGEIVEAKLQRATEAKQAQLQASQTAYARQTELTNIAIGKFLEAVKVSFTHDIRNGRFPPESVIIPQGAPFNTDTWRFTEALHSAYGMTWDGYTDSQRTRHKEPFDKFFEWVKAQHLYVGIRKLEDGRFFVFCWSANTKK